MAEMIDCPFVEVFNVECKYCDLWYCDNVASCPQREDAWCFIQIKRGVGKKRGGDCQRERHRKT